MLGLWWTRWKNLPNENIIKMYVDQVLIKYFMRLASIMKLSNNEANFMPL